jgi:hypothetical protein
MIGGNADMAGPATRPGQRALCCVCTTSEQRTPHPSDLPEYPVAMHAASLNDLYFSK